jgi:D-glycero-alpha-D-manno-heptose-7-phosphate kinase
LIIRARSPLRLGLAGGGTDVSPYSDLYGGAILNATINRFAYATLEPLDEPKIILHSVDRNETHTFETCSELQIQSPLSLLKGIYNRIVKDFVKEPMHFRLSTYVDAPPGSGLGSSSSLVIAIIAAFAEWKKIPLGEYELAQLAYDIERKDLAMAGGKQDQYAATFGGVNFMEFLADDQVIVNPLRIKSDHLKELEFNILLYNTGTSRLSSSIIEMQSANVKAKKEKSIDAMHKLKEQALWMKEALLKGQLTKMGEIMHFGWQHKKEMADGISNPMLDEIYEAALNAGATGGKISGAGGGGFMFFFCPANSRYPVMQALSKFGGHFHTFQFTEHGATSWTIK